MTRSKAGAKVSAGIKKSCNKAGEGVDEKACKGSGKTYKKHTKAISKDVKRGARSFCSSCQLVFKDDTFSFAECGRDVVDDPDDEF